jgi:hypothetical protein
MEKTIESIISKLPNGTIFDAHAIINNLIWSHHDVYLADSGTCATEDYHNWLISEYIDTFEGSLIKSEGTSWSADYSGVFSINRCWKKIN